MSINRSINRMEDEFRDKDLEKVYYKIDKIVWFLRERFIFPFFLGFINTILLALILWRIW